MPENDKHLRPTGIFNWNPLATEEGIDAYVRECRATGDSAIIEEAEYLAELARAELVAQSQE